jgi:hypothetical protein
MAEVIKSKNHTIPCISRYPASKLRDLLLKNMEEAPFPRKATTGYYEKFDEAG